MMVGLQESLELYHSSRIYSDLRRIYPASEITANPVNYNDAVKRLSDGDKMTSRVWWDKK